LLNRFYIEVSCSKGTYIRSLCEDIGKKLGGPACMGALTRTRSGVFLIENAVTLPRLKQAASEEDLTQFILPVEQILPYPFLTVKEEFFQKCINGNPVPLHAVVTAGEIVEKNKYWLYGRGKLIGLFAYNENKQIITPEVML
jgi:tRNA pseudouridine55 synthase